jgi:uncharacterized membrane protein
VEQVSGKRLLALAYADTAGAEQALVALSELAGERALVIEDAVVVTRAGDGGVEVKQHEGRGLAAGEGLVGGGMIGLLVGLLAGIPIAAAVLGAAGGAGASLFDRGVSHEELERVARSLEEHAAALIALVDRADWPRIHARLAPYGGVLIASDGGAEVVEGPGSAEP